MRVEICQGGFITNAPRLASCLPPLAARSSRIRALADKTEACWTATARGLFTQKALTQAKLQKDEITVLAIGDGDAFGTTFKWSGCGDQTNTHRPGTRIGSRHAQNVADSLGTKDSFGRFGSFFL